MMMDTSQEHCYHVHLPNDGHVSLLSYLTTAKFAILKTEKMIFRVPHVGVGVGVATFNQTLQYFS
jgi:hypothetical protein